MCRSKEHGGNRCRANNARRRDRYAVKTAQTIVDSVIKEHGQEFTGDVAGLGFQINSPMVAKAYAVATRAHAGVKRVSGEVYINHPLAVAKSLQDAGFNHEVISAALLHDSVEDSDLTFGGLRKLGFNERVIGGVESMTKRKGEDYQSAILRAIEHPIGRVGKLADNLHNSSDEQLAPFDEARQAKQRAKYIPARAVILRSILDNPTDHMIEKTPGFSKEYKIKLNPEIMGTIFDGKK
jgi:(p)ppGpp synthase/HD superfamily hydrolase